MDQDNKTLADYLDILLRRKKAIALIFTLIGFVSLVLAYLLPLTYRSTALLLMEAPLPKSLLQSAVTDYVDEQIKSITQKVMTADSVLAIIEAHNLYDFADNRLEKYELAEQFKRDTDISLVNSSLISQENVGATDVAFMVSFVYGQPQKARDVAAKLAGLFIEQNDRARTQRAARAADFLSEEVEKLNRHIQELDGRISAYKNKYKYSLPEYTPTNLSALDRKQSELQDLTHQIRLATERTTFLAVELTRVPPEPSRGISQEKTQPDTGDGLSALRAKYLRAASRYSPDHPDVIRARRQLEALDPEFRANPAEADIRKQLDELGGKLAMLREKNYPETHPDVLRVKSQMERLEQRLDGKPASLLPRKNAESARISSNPAYFSLQAQYRSAQAELDSLAQRKKAVQAELESLQARVTLAPEVEKGYTELVRERDHTLNKYNQLKEKLQDARLVRTLEEGQQGQTLTIIEQPVIPTHAEKSARRKVAFGGLLLGLIASIGYAFFAEMLDPRIQGYRMVAEITGIMPLVTIPYIEAPPEVEARLAAHRRLRKILVWSGMVLAVLAIAILCLISFPALQLRLGLANLL